MISTATFVLSPTQCGTYDATLDGDSDVQQAPMESPSQ